MSCLCGCVYISPNTMSLGLFDGALVAELIWRTLSWVCFFSAISPRSWFFPHTPEETLLKPPMSRAHRSSIGSNEPLYFHSYGISFSYTQCCSQVTFFSLKLPLFFPWTILTPQITGVVASVGNLFWQQSSWRINRPHTTVGEQQMLLFCAGSELCFIG